MRVLITGGTGLIGRELVQELIENSHQPIVLSRSPKLHPDFPDGVRVHPWDARTTEGWGHLIEEVDAVVNLAGENLAGTNFFPSRWTAERKQRILDSRLYAGQALVKAIEAAEHKPKVLIQSSAIGYYGSQGDQQITEAEGAGDDFVAVTSVRWEASTAPVEAFGVRRVVIRTGIALNAEEGALWRILLPYRLFVGGPFGSGRQWYSWIHEADVAGAIRALIENDQAKGAYNLTAPKPLTNRDFGKALGRVMRRPSLVLLPGFVMRALFGEVATVVLEGQRVLPKGLEDLGYEFRFPTAEAAFKDLLA